jgi:N-acetylneuraminic acid mutarotase
MDSNESQQVDYRLEWRRVKPRTMTTPRIRSCSAGTWLSGNLFLFGGKGAGQFNDTWRFSIQDKEWEKIYFNDSIAPFARDGHAIAKVSETSVMLFGGQGQQIECGKSERNTDQGRVKFLSMRQLMDDLHEFNCSTLKWEEKKRVKPRPSGRRGHSLTFLPVRTNIRKGTLPANSSSGPPKGNILLFGGSVFDLSSGCEKPSNEVWIYSLDTEKWIEIKINGISPPPTFGHAATLVGDQLVVVGGNVPHQYRRQGMLTLILTINTNRNISYSSK